MIKLYEKAEEAVIDRDFTLAISLLETSIEKDKGFREAYLKLASIYSLYQDKESTLHYYQGYISVTPHEQVSWRIWKNLAYLNFSFGHYEKAKEAIMELLSQKPEHTNDPDLNLLKESIDFSVSAVKNGEDLNVYVLPAEVNRFALQYFPVLTVDGQTLIYTKRDSNRDGSDEDIVFSMKTDSGWSVAQTISDEINTELNEGACSISADGRVLVFTSCDDGRTFGSCDLFVSNKIGDAWSKPVNMGSVVNSSHWDSQPSLSSDGRKLFFSSNRPGGFGKRDLWETNMVDGQWSKPVNMGSKVNGIRDETTPFVHAGNNVLVYSSNSFPGLGGYDLFFTERENNIWNVPQNLGYPINSFKDEISLFISADGTQAYYAQEKMEKGMVVESNIVSFQILSDSFNVEKVSYVTGVVSNNETGLPLDARLKLMNLNDSTDTYITHSDPEAGSYFLTLRANQEYGVFVERQGYLFANLSFEARENALMTPDTVNIGLDRIQVGKSIVLKNIYFEFSSYELGAKSRAELQSIVQYLMSNKNVSFQIEGHTDSQGDPTYNQKLSEQRAQAVFDFLVERGISSSRMVVKGFGASQPLDNTPTEIAHKVNRRITFKVLK